jgi:hypothetical protein
MDLFGRPAIHGPTNAPELSFPRHLSPVLRIVKPLPIVLPDKEADQPDPRRERRRRSRHAFRPLALAPRTQFLARFRISCEAGLGDFTADPPKDGSATVFKAEARSTRSKEFLIKKFSDLCELGCLCGEYVFTENLTIKSSGSPGLRYRLKHPRRFRAFSPRFPVS